VVIGSFGESNKRISSKRQYSIQNTKGKVNGRN
jgi:hypothetical protein